MTLDSVGLKKENIYDYLFTGAWEQERLRGGSTLIRSSNLSIIGLAAECLSSYPGRRDIGENRQKKRVLDRQ